MRHLTSLVAVLTLLAGGPSASAEPIEPQTLRMLAEQAELIAVARVGARSPLASPPGHHSWVRRELVTLVTLRTLKGSAGARSLLVARQAGLRCPPPARYKTGSTVLAFLYRDRRLESVTPAVTAPLWSTQGLSYGSRRIVGSPDDSGLVKRTEECLAILALEPGRSRSLRMTSWLVDCVLTPATRWDGLRDLRPNIYWPSGKFVTHWDYARIRRAIEEKKSKRELRRLLQVIKSREAGSGPNPRLELLTSESIERLWRALRDDDQLLDPGDGALVDLVGALRPKRVARRLCLELTRMLQLRLDSYLPGARRFMRKAADLLDWERGRALAKSADAELWKAVETFVKEAAEVLPAEESR